MGAWIETYVLPLVDVQPMSPLAWGRGLKLGLFAANIRTTFVAPRVGAWIETSPLDRLKLTFLSPLAWGRGLKPMQAPPDPIGGLSPLAWGRGLKLGKL